MVWTSITVFIDTDRTLESVRRPWSCLQSWMYFDSWMEMEETDLGNTDVAVSECQSQLNPRVTVNNCSFSRDEDSVRPITRWLQFEC